MARDPQVVYDMNIMAIKLAEDPEVRLPVIVSFDGYFTSHQKSRVQVLRIIKKFKSLLVNYQQTSHML